MDAERSQVEAGSASPDHQLINAQLRSGSEKDKETVSCFSKGAMFQVEHHTPMAGIEGGTSAGCILIPEKRRGLAS